VQWLIPTLPWTLALQTHSELKPLMLLLSFFGSQGFFLVALPTVYWCVDRRIGRRLGMLVILNSALNDILKVLFALPRPYWVSGKVQAWAPEKNYGMPSGHAQGAAAVWPFLASQLAPRRRPAAFAGAVVLVVAISLSRVFLGAHFAADTFLGAPLGLCVWLIYARWIVRAEAFFVEQSLFGQLLVAGIGAVGMVVAYHYAAAIGIFDSPLHAVGLRYPPHPGESTPIFDRAGAFFGLLSGLAFGEHSARFNAEGTAREKALRMLFGLLGVAVLYLGPVVLTPAKPSAFAHLMHFGRYALVAWWIVYAAPLLFLRWNLCRKTMPPRERRRRFGPKL